MLIGIIWPGLVLGLIAVVVLSWERIVTRLQRVMRIGPARAQLGDDVVIAAYRREKSRADRYARDGYPTLLADARRDAAKWERVLKRRGIAVPQ